MENDNIHRTDQDLEVREIEPREATVSLITRAEMETQLSWAESHPRSLTKFRDRALSLATFSVGVAASCEYALKKGEVTHLGPSVRLAEIVASTYGNLRYGSRIVDNDGRVITAQGSCHDLENNTSGNFEVKRLIIDERGQRFNDEGILLAGLAANAIAIRNAIFKVIPSAIIMDIMADVRKVAKGTIETLPERRDATVNYFMDQGVKAAQICELMEVARIEDIDLDKLAVLNAYRATVENQEGVLKDIFKIKPGHKKAAINKSNKALEELHKVLDKKGIKKPPVKK